MGPMWAINAWRAKLMAHDFSAAVMLE